MSEVTSTPIVLVIGTDQTQNMIEHSPFTIGRVAGSDLLLQDPYISRRHAEFVAENGEFFIVDKGSRHGTYLNGQRLKEDDPQRLAVNDAVHFGSLEGPLVRFGVRVTQTGSAIRDLLGHIQPSGSTTSAIDKLRWFLEAARKLNDVGAVDQILTSLVETTLQLTKVERGFVLLRDKASNEMRLAVGLTSTGVVLTSDATISHSAIEQAIRGTGEFIVTDTLTADSNARTQSIVAQNIRTVICIPLRSRRVIADTMRGEVLGVLYLDSRMNPGNLTQVDNDLLKTIATEAAALVDNAQLAISEESERRYREELEIAKNIQKNLMAVDMPDIPFAKITAHFEPCKEIGGDFYDVVAGDDGVSIVLADVSGKGVSAALLAQTMQGMVYAQLLAGQSLELIATALNRYICTKNIGKYATMVVAHLHPDGELHYINCGHVQPLLRTKAGVQLLDGSNLPVGLIAGAQFESHVAHMEKGSRLLLVTDGVTEAENEATDFYGNTRLEEALGSSSTLQDIFESISCFCGTAAATDDCTLVEVVYC
jgi:sigma-B regulation protein RsbU (phosphoserine phosphatase)